MNGAVNGAPTAQSTDLVPADGGESTVAPWSDALGGAGMAPFSDAIRAELAKPVDPEIVEIKPDGIPYVPGVEWRRALTRAFGAGGWAIFPRIRPPAHQRLVGNAVTWYGALICHGRMVSEAVGEAKYNEKNPNSSWPTALEGAKTDVIGRCCKDLTIYSELWNPPWLETFKRDYCESYRGSKTTWENGKRVEKPATLWRRKDYAKRLPPDHLDLIAGAGGQEPVARVASPATAPGNSSTSSTGTSSPPSASTAAAPAATSPATDTGEVATPEQLAAIKAEVKRHGWKMDFARQWFGRHFGLTTQGMSADRILGQLSAQQAATVTLLLTAFGTNVYETLLAQQQEAGRCR